jgi:hypothetical protein
MFLRLLARNKLVPIPHVQQATLSTAIVKDFQLSEWQQFKLAIAARRIS